MYAEEPGKGFPCDIHPHCVKEKEKNWGSLGKLLFQDLRGSWLGLEGDLTLALLPLFVKNVSFVNPEKLFFLLLLFTLINFVLDLK